MESSSTPAKEKKGIKQLWNKIKLAFRSKSKDKKKSPTSVPGSSNTQAIQTVTTQQQNRESPPLAHTAATDAVPITILDRPIPVVEAPSEPTTEMPTTSAMEAESELEPLQVESVQQPKRQLDNQLSSQPASQTVATDEAKEELARRYERAQAIFQKYNIDISEAGWDVRPKPHIERVRKQTRIRVRWTCHECKTTFGHEKICVECAHQRCKTCVRHPSKRKKVRDAKKAALTISTEPSTSKVHDGACHECQTIFKIGSEECSNCHHTICHRCLQESLASAEQDEERTTVII